MKQHTNLCTDLSKIVEQDPVKYRKVRDDVITLRETSYDIIVREATEKAYEKAEQKAEQKAYEKEVKMVLNMIKIGQSDENIHFVTSMSIEEIAKIREEQSNQ